MELTDLIGTPFSAFSFMLSVARDDWPFLVGLVSIVTLVSVASVMVWKKNKAEVEREESAELTAKTLADDLMFMMQENEENIAEEERAFDGW
jgi:hypothetical protein